MSGAYSRNNCAQGHPVHNRHNNCPYSLMCATCDMEDDDGENAMSEIICGP